MTLLKPTTSQLMDLLPEWNILRNTLGTRAVEKWRSENVPWTWTPEEFEIQTRMLAAGGCSPRNMVEWLICGVRWGKTSSINGEMEFNEKLTFWIDHRSYHEVSHL